MADLVAEKTHEATPYRHQEARRHGEVARSSDLVAALILFGFGSGLMVCGNALTTSLSSLFTASLRADAWRGIESVDVVAEMRAAIVEYSKIAWPLVSGLILLAILAHVVQGSVVWRPAKLTRQAPFRPFHRISVMFSASRLAVVLLSVAKASVVMTVAFFCLWNQREMIARLPHLGIEQVAVELPRLLLRAGMWAMFALVVLGLLDYVVQRWFLERQLRMTPQEVREETKSREGEPRIRARRLALHGDLVSPIRGDANEKTAIEAHAAATFSTYPNR